MRTNPDGWKGRVRQARWWVFALLGLGLLSGLALGVAVWEMRSSTLQARWLTPIASELSWRITEGPSERIVFPEAGPHDERLGYARLPGMITSAEERGFRIAEQAEVSERLSQVVDDWGLFPIYSEKAQAGLTIVGRSGEPLLNEVFPRRVYPSFESIPPVVWQTLLFIENRTLLDPDQPRKNPAVEWPRLFQSTAELGLRYLGREGNVAGASTLATQLEKFRHSPAGLTSTPVEKLEQMASASLRAYLEGEETLPVRRRIVLDYINSVPLAAAPGEGEVNGLGDGLWAWYGQEFRSVNQVLASIPSSQTESVPSRAAVLPLGTPDAASFWVVPEQIPESEIPDGVGDSFVRPAGAEGRPTAEIQQAGSTGGNGTASADLAEQGAAFREVLSLVLSQRRPTYYLARAEGREALRTLTDQYLALVEQAGIVSPRLAEAARQTEPSLLSSPPPRPEVSFVERKGVNAVRTQMLGLLGVQRLYDLDRLDVTARTTIDGPAQRATTDFLVNLGDPQFVRTRGLDAYRLLDRGDPAQVVYSLVLHERTDRGNLVRIQTDNLDAPFNLNESARLELGSTAKLRTLATYLQVIAEQHGRYSTMPTDSLRAIPLSPRDALGRWTRAQVLTYPALELSELLRRSLQRTYSASPNERFVTGGGVQTFSNFDDTYDRSVITVATAFQQSVNLVFVRMMRDIVNHYIYRVPGSTAHILDDTDSPLRVEYLQRFADREGIQFIDQFIPKYRDGDRTEVLRALVRDRRLSPQRIAWAYRTVAPDATRDEFEFVLRTNQPDAEFQPETIDDLFRRADPESQDLADLGYLASVHPLELWVARHFIENPGATRSQIIEESTQARQDVYRWLFRTSRQSAQDQRIRSLLEVEAFTQILEGWQALGYPFGNIVPSLGTSIGSSGDRPSALSELVGIIVNEGVHVPTYRLEELHFADETPFETRMVREGEPGERVMTPEVAQVLSEAMIDVVEAGTARRVRGGLTAPDGTSLTLGGKTGTGDNRYRVFGPGGREIESRSVNRTSTFVFFIEDRYYGVITAYVPGEAADDYWFTSALPVQIMRELAPVVEALIDDSASPLTGEDEPAEAASLAGG